MIEPLREQQQEERLYRKTSYMLLSKCFMDEEFEEEKSNIFVCKYHSNQFHQSLMSCTLYLQMDIQSFTDEKLTI